MTIVISINTALFPQKEIKLHISYSKFKAKTSITQISSWSILQKVVQLTHLKIAPQNKHGRHQIYNRTLNMKDLIFLVSLLKYTSQLKESGLNFVTGCKLLLGSNRSFSSSKSKRYFQESTSETLLSPSYTFQFPVSPTLMHLQPGSLVRTS